MNAAIRACEAPYQARAAGFLRIARAVERFCYPLARSFWPTGSGIGPLVGTISASELDRGGYSVAMASLRCVRKSGVAVRGAATGLSLYDRRRLLQSACAEVRVLTHDYDLDWLARRVGVGLMGREL